MRYFFNSKTKLVSPDSCYASTTDFNRPTLLRTNYPSWVRDSQSLVLFLWNPFKKAIFGRTPTEFLKLITFYATFYVILFSSVLGVYQFYAYFFIMKDYPTLTGYQSSLGLNPGLSVVPMPDRLSSLIRIKVGSKYSYGRHLESLVAFTQWYEDHGASAETDGSTLEDCSRTGQLSDPGNTRKACRQRLEIGGPCNIVDSLGSDEGTPCFVLKLNRIYGWLPQPVDNATGVGVKCEGVNESDRENMGPITYYDDDFLTTNEGKKDGAVFKSYYYPYLKQQSYQSPLVFFQLESPTRHQILMIDCYAIAKNIVVDRNMRQGSVRIELIVD